MIDKSIGLLIPPIWNWWMVNSKRDRSKFGWLALYMHGHSCRWESIIWPLDWLPICVHCWWKRKKKLWLISFFDWFARRSESNKPYSKDLRDQRFTKSIKYHYIYDFHGVEDEFINKSRTNVVHDMAFLEAEITSVQ